MFYSDILFVKGITVNIYIIIYTLLIEKKQRIVYKDVAGGFRAMAGSFLSTI